MKRIFLSFADEDAARVKRLVPLFSGSGYELDYYSGSLPGDFDSPQAREIKRALGEMIIKCNVAVCLVGENTHRSKWVDIELEKNRNKGNRIIAMALKGTVEAVLPKAIQEENLRFYPWDPQRLKELITEEPVQLFKNAYSF